MEAVRVLRLEVMPVFTKAVCQTIKALRAGAGGINDVAAAASGGAGLSGWGKVAWLSTDGSFG